MGCGRVGSELSHALGAAGHDVTVIDKRPDAFDRYPPGDHARRIVGLGFDRDVLEEAGIREADAFIAVSSGDNSNIVSARVALEHYHVPKVIARIFDDTIFHTRAKFYGFAFACYHFRQIHAQRQPQQFAGYRYHTNRN